MIPAIAQAAKYLQDKLGHKLYALPPETFKNSRENGTGVRFIVGDTVHAFRLNFSGSEITGIDIWNGTTSDPNAHIEINTHTSSLNSIIPLLASEIANPHVGDQEIVVAEFVISNEDHALTEAPKKWTPEILTNLAIQFITKNPERISKAAFGGVAGGFNNAGVIDIITGMYPDEFEKVGKSVQFIGDPSALDYDAILKEVQSKTVTMTVEAGGSNETYGETGVEKKISDEIKRIPYEEQLDHMEALVKAVVAGAGNSLFIAGAPGASKTYTVEKTLKSLGMSDGNGYFKQTGSASAIGLYAILYNNRNNLILFDDCDTLLQASGGGGQEARNLIKAATDTRKDRKVAWGKRSSMIYDTDSEEIDADLDGIEKFPNYFYFTGTTIFITNLSMEQLDSDGAIRSRSFMININPTKTELFDYMEKILPHINPEAGSMTMEQKNVVFGIVKTSRRDDVNLRKLIRAMNLASSGVPGWEKLIELYA